MSTMISTEHNPFLAALSSPQVVKRVVASRRFADVGGGIAVSFPNQDYTATCYGSDFVQR
jgi:hypothetical protein